MNFFWWPLAYCIFEGLCTFVAWCAVGVFIMRSKIGMGDVIPMIHYNYRWLGVALFFGVIVFWPIYLLWYAGLNGWGYYQLWREKKRVKWSVTMPRKTHDLLKTIMAREQIATKKEYMQRAFGMHDYLTEKRAEGYKLYLKKDDETEYHELELP